MEKRELSKEEIISLIGEFKSEVRKCLAKIDIYNQKIEEFTKLLGNGIENQPIIRKKEKTRKPYPLSKWDNIILDIIKENGRPTTSKDIYVKAMTRAEKAGIAMDENKMKAKINQCLVKLSGHRNDLMKVKYGGRGFAYSFPEWIAKR